MDFSYKNTLAKIWVRFGEVVIGTGHLKETQEIN